MRNGLAKRIDEVANTLPEPFAKFAQNMAWTVWERGMFYGNYDSVGSYHDVEDFMGWFNDCVAELELVIDGNFQKSIDIKV